MPPSPPPDLSSVPGGRLGRAVVRWADRDGTRRELAQRRLGRPVLLAVPLMSRAVLGRDRRVLLALTDDTLYVLESPYISALSRRPHRVVGALPRAGLAAYFRRRLTVVRAELSWPHHQTLLVGDLPRGAATDKFIGLVMADELERLSA